MMYLSGLLHPRTCLWLMMMLTLFLTTCLTHAASAEAMAAAEIIGPLAIIQVEGAGLRFGRLAPHEGGRAILAPDGRLSCIGVEEMSCGTIPTAARFRVIGYPERAFSISLPQAITLSCDSYTMRVDAFSSNPNGSGTLNTDGEAILRVGGTLHVDANQPPGCYSGSFTVTVAYN